MATKPRPFHLVVFGASGFTGQFVTEEVAREQLDCRLPWAVAGRSREKLQRVLERAAQRLGKGGGAAGPRPGGSPLPAPGLPPPERAFVLPACGPGAPRAQLEGRRATAAPPAGPWLCSPRHLRRKRVSVRLWNFPFSLRGAPLAK